MKLRDYRPNSMGSDTEKHDFQTFCVLRSRPIRQYPLKIEHVITMDDKITRGSRVQIGYDT